MIVNVFIVKLNKKVMRRKAYYNGFYDAVCGHKHNNWYKEYVSDGHTYKNPNPRWKEYNEGYLAGYFEYHTYFNSSFNNL
jgi:hypothetical protein